MIQIIEIKVLHEWFLRYIINNPETAYWNKQISFYTDKIAELYNQSVQGGALLVDRSSGKMHYMPFEYQDYEEELEILNTCYEEDILPECADEKTCDKCQLKKLCKKNEFNSLSEFIEIIKTNGFINE